MAETKRQELMYEAYIKNKLFEEEWWYEKAFRFIVVVILFSILF